jgi:hypothetical protein
MAQSRAPIELSEEEDQAERLLAAVNIEADGVNGDGLDERPEDSLCALSEEDRQIFANVFKRQRSGYNKRDLSKALGHWP